MIEISTIRAWRHASGPAGSGVEVLVEGRWVMYSTGPHEDAAAAEMRDAGVPRHPDRAEDGGGKCLVVCYPQSHGPAWHGHCGENRRIVSAGHTFTGREGIVGGPHPSGEHFRDTTVSTGWYRPVEWLTIEEAARRLTPWESETSYDDGSPRCDAGGYLRQLAASFAATPDDFPGLREHYPEVAAAFDIAPAAS